MLRGGVEDRPHERFEWTRLTTSRSLAVLCVMYFCAIYGWYFYLTWLPTYLLRARGFDLRQAGWLAALPLLSIALGVFLGGWLSDRFATHWGARRGRRVCGVVGLPVAAAAILGGIGTSEPMTSELLLALAGGAAALGVAPAWAVSLEIGGMHAGVVSGAMNMCGNLGGTLSPLVVGFALERWPAVSSKPTSRSDVGIRQTMSPCPGPGAPITRRGGEPGLMGLAIFPGGR